MPRLRNIEPTVKLACWIPEVLHARLLVEAYSPLLGKTPPRGLTLIVTAALQTYFDIKDGKKVLFLPQTKETSDV
jgi:hypothetical protein